MRRRSFLGLAIAGAVGLLPQTAGARSGATHVLRPKSAPYPAPNGKYSDSTVLVYLPSFFSVPSSKKVDFVVHFHGHMTTAKAAIAAHKLREQLEASRQNAVLVVPQGPVRAADGDFGKLMLKGGLGRLLAEVRKSVPALRVAKQTGRVVLSSHSGGYRAAAACATLGGVDAREIYLFDSLYGEVDTFARFVTADREHHKLIAYSVGGKPRELGAALASRLESEGVDVVRETGTKRVTRGELVDATAAFLYGQATHATATYEELALRDCLFASCLKGKGSRRWHEKRDRARSS